LGLLSSGIAASVARTDFSLRREPVLAKQRLKFHNRLV
jgi:hypothetical protein